MGIILVGPGAGSGLHTGGTYVGETMEEAFTGKLRTVYRCSEEEERELLVSFACIDLVSAKLRAGGWVDIAAVHQELRERFSDYPRMRELSFSCDVWALAEASAQEAGAEHVA